MAETLRNEEKALLELLRAALNESYRLDEDALPESVCREEWEKLIRLAREHAVLSLLYEPLSATRRIPADCMQEVEKAGRVTAQSSYRLLFLTKYLTQLLREHGIAAITLKGAATASFYPVPELRKAGDVDILIADEARCEEACRLLRAEGYEPVGHQLTIHHMELKNEEGISVEVHGMLAEPFDSQSVNRYLRRLLPEYKEHMVENTSWGVSIYQPSDGYHAFYLILHMLQHYLRAGFGVKNLCDWVVFWNREVEEKEREIFLRLIEESGTLGFVEIMTVACVEYMGLPKERVTFLLTKEISQRQTQQFMKEVFAAGEYGKSDRTRMVAMRGTGIGSYIREFHHQMHLNFPKLGHVCLLWPFLWAFTLHKFLANNRRIRNISGREILREAARRSELTEQMRLFETVQK